jgi:hypothetical protein
MMGCKSLRVLVLALFFTNASALLARSRSTGKSQCGAKNSPSKKEELHYLGWIDANVSSLVHSCLCGRGSPVQRWR